MSDYKDKSNIAGVDGGYLYKDGGIEYGEEAVGVFEDLPEKESAQKVLSGERDVEELYTDPTDPTDPSEPDDDYWDDPLPPDTGCNTGCVDDCGNTPPGSGGLIGAPDQICGSFDVGAKGVAVFKAERSFEVPSVHAKPKEP